MALTAEDVRMVALLARLELKDAEVDKQTMNLNALIDQFQKLQDLDVTGVEPTSHSFPVYNILREDVALPSLSREDILANAPAAVDGCFIVPRIVEG